MKNLHKIDFLFHFIIYINSVEQKSADIADEKLNLQLVAFVKISLSFCFTKPEASGISSETFLIKCKAHILVINSESNIDFLFLFTFNMSKSKKEKKSSEIIKRKKKTLKRKEKQNPTR